MTRLYNACVVLAFWCVRSQEGGLGRGWVGVGLMGQGCSAIPPPFLGVKYYDQLLTSQVLSGLCPKVW